jgi:hypothetical protein
MIERSFAGILRRFGGAGIEFLVVGDLAIALHGAPPQTLAVELVHSRDAANVARLVPVLSDLDAIFRIQPERRLKPAASHLASSGHLNLITRHGPLDLLGTIGQGLSYEDLLPHTVDTQIAEGMSIKVLDLPTLIALKEELSDEKDRAMLPILRRTLEESRRDRR